MEFDVCVALGYGQQSLTSCTFMEQVYLATFFSPSSCFFFPLVLRFIVWEALWNRFDGMNVHLHEIRKHRAHGPT
jgi:hypothetical protein